MFPLSLAKKRNGLAFIIKEGLLRVSFQSGFLSAQKSAQRKKRSTKKALKQVQKSFFFLKKVAMRQRLVIAAGVF